MAETKSTPYGRNCTKCLQFKSWDNFTKAKKGLMGKSSRCKSCARLYFERTRIQVNARQLARYHRLQEPKRAAKRAELEQVYSSAYKKCGRCKQTKARMLFGLDKTRADGFKSRCKDCRRVEFSDQVARKGRNQKSDSWRARNPEKSKAIAKRHNGAVHNRIHHSISARIYATLRGKGGKRTLEIIGYTVSDLSIHLEKQFLTGMNWDNYGEWHIDHIVPLSSFKIEGINDKNLRRAWALSNLRPLWGKDNISKNAKRTHLI